MRLFTVVNPTFENFHDDEVLKKTAAVLALAQSFRGRNLAEPGAKACVGKEKFWPLDDRCPGNACSGEMTPALSATESHCLAI